MAFALISLALAPLAAAQFSYIPAELSGVISYQEVRFTECNDYIHTCAPTISSCAAVICQECTGLGQSRLASCCAEDSAPTACFATALLVSQNPTAALGSSFTAQTTSGAEPMSTAVDTTATTHGAVTAASTTAAATTTSSGSGGKILGAGAGLAGVVLALAMYL